MDNHTCFKALPKYKSYTYPAAVDNAIRIIRSVHDSGMDSQDNNAGISSSKQTPLY